MKIAGHLSLCLMVLLMLAALFTFLAPRFGWRVDAVLSGSMEPEIRVGSIVVTRPLPAQDIRAGDIITFYAPPTGNLTSHRVVEIVHDSPNYSSPDYFRAKGDANEDADPFIVPPGNIVGRVCFQIPYLGYVSQFVKSRLGLLLTLFIPGLIIIAIEIRNIWRVLAEEEIERKYRVVR